LESSTKKLSGALSGTHRYSPHPIVLEERHQELKEEEEYKEDEPVEDEEEEEEDEYIDVYEDD
jgi:hypothetical protein